MRKLSAVPHAYASVTSQYNLVLAMHYGFGVYPPTGTLTPAVLRRKMIHNL